LSYRFGQFISELKRRHVWQVLLAYAAVVFVLLQLGEIVFPAFGAPPWALRVLVVSAFVGFPVVLVLGWLFELTPQGVRKTLPIDRPGTAGTANPRLPLPQLTLLVVTVVTAGGVGWWAIRDSLSEEAAALTGGNNLAVPIGAVEDETPPVRSLAVLPLDDFSEEEGGQYFTAGMHEELISQLGQLGTVRVLSRTSVVQFDRTGKTMPEIASELGVEGVVEGSVFRTGDRVRITVQLIYGPEDRHLWANSYDGTMEDAITLQRDVAQEIAKEIRAELLVDEETVPAPPRVAANPGAQDSYLRGRYEQAKATPEALESAEWHYQEAVRQDSTFAPAFAGLAASRFLLGLNRADSSPPVSAEEMEVVGPLERALQLDENSPEAGAVLLTLHEALGSLPEMSLPEGIMVTVDSVVMPVGAEFSLAATDFGRQLQRIAVARGPKGPSEGEALRRLTGARRLQAAGDYARAEEVLKELVETSPELHQVWDALEYLKAQQGDFEGAVEIRKERLTHLEVDTEAEASLVQLENQMKEGETRAFWTWRVEDMGERRALGQKVSPVEEARALVALEELDGAIVLLQEGLEKGDRNLLSLWTDPAWDPLRQDPRFRELLTKLRRKGGKPGPHPPGTDSMMGPLR
jgi:TolB-like protein